MQLHPIEENAGIILVIDGKEILGGLSQEALVRVVPQHERGWDLVLKTGRQDEMVERNKIAVIDDHVFLLTVDGRHFAVDDVDSCAERNLGEIVLCVTMTEEKERKESWNTFKRKS